LFLKLSFVSLQPLWSSHCTQNSSSQNMFLRPLSGFQSTCRIMTAVKRETWNPTSINSPPILPSQHYSVVINHSILIICSDNTSLEFVRLDLFKQASIRCNSSTLHDIFPASPNLVTQPNKAMMFVLKLTTTLKKPKSTQY
jgi:hypothetical protein